MKSFIRIGASNALCLLIGAGALFSMPERAPAQESASAPSPEEQLAQRFSELQAEVERLKTTGDGAAATILADELTRARTLFEGEFQVKRTDVPELHAVAVHKGGSAPPGTLKGNDRYTRGYAEISVTHTAAPLILCASTVERVHFQFKVAPDVRLAAVILSGRYTPSLGGLPEGTLVLNRAGDSPNAMGVSPMGWRDGSFQHAAQVLREYTGKELLTVTAAQRFAGKPLVVGPENKTWCAQYLMGQTEGAHRRAAEAARTEQLKRFANVRFRALIYHSQRDGLGDGTAAEAEFTVAGPVIDTMKPIDKVIRHLVHEPKSGLDFAIDHWTQLIVVDPKAQEYPKVPLDESFPREVRLNTLGFDTKRNRFVLNQRDAPHGVYAYDLEKATWQVLQKKGPNLAALTYVPETDEFWGVTVSDNYPSPENKNKGASFCRLSADGELVEQFRPPQDVTNTFGDFGGTTLVVHDEMLIVVTPPDVSHHRQQNPDGQQPSSHIHLVDPKKQEVTYSGPAVPHDGKTAPSADDTTPTPSGKGLLHRLFDRLQLADQTVEKLRRQGEAKRANELATSVQAVRNRLGGKRNPDPKADPQLHLVGSYGANGTIVELTPQPSPVILVLCSYERAQWTIRAAEEVTIERIIIGGYHKQSVKESPAGVSVETYSHDERTNGFYTYGIESDGHTQAMNRIKELTGMEPTTLQHAPRPGGPPVVIGDTNGAWLVQSVVAKLDELLQEAMYERQALRRKELDGFTFDAPYRTGTAGQPPHERGQLQYGKFTIRGPMPQMLVNVPDRMEQVAVDPGTGDWYVRRGSEIRHINSKTDESTQIDWDAGLPDLSWPSAIAFDTLRQRLLLTSFGGGGYLYAYDVGQRKWSVICRPGLSTNAMLYVPDGDLIYAVNLSHGGEGVQTLRKFNAHGALIESYTLPHPIGRGQSRGPFAGIDLAYFNGRIAILGPTVPDPLDPSLLAPQIHVFDLETKNFVYAGVMRPHPGVLKLSPHRLDELWQLLADRDEQKADKAVWDMAAGHAASVEYVASHMPPIPKTDEAEVKQLIAQLDSDDFDTRRKAQEKLASFGGLIAPLLEAHKRSPSAEVRATIRRLTTAIEQNAPASPELAREVRAVKVLELIATPEAVKLLEQLSRGVKDAERTRAANQSLERLAKISAATK
jgi:hypothetical protein